MIVLVSALQEYAKACDDTGRKSDGLRELAIEIENARFRQVQGQNNPHVPVVFESLAR